MKEEGNKKKILALVVSLALCLSMIVPLQAATKPAVSSVTYKVTFQSSNKKKTILNVQASDAEKTPKGYEWGKHEK